MIAIREIGVYVPATRQSNFERSRQFELDERFIVEKLGVEQVSRRAATEETSDLCVKAFKDLERRLGRPLGEPACLAVCTQNPDGRGLPHTSAIVHAKLGFADQCACFDVSLGCSGYVYGLSLVKSFMRENGFLRGLFFTADPYSKIVDTNDRNTALLFGDAAAVTLLEASTAPDDWYPRLFRFATRGKGASALENRDGVLNMNGRAVFNFSATDVPPQVRAVLQDAGLSAADIDLFLFHQGSRFIVEQLGKRLGLPADRVPINLAAQGNTVSSSLPLLLQHYLHDSKLARIVLSGFGVGLSWASCLLTRGSGDHQ